MYLNEERQNIFLKGLDHFKENCNSHNKENVIKIIINNLGVRLYKKLVENNEIIDNCYTDLDLATEKYFELINKGIKPRLIFIAPSIAVNHGEEEYEKWRLFSTKIGLNIEQNLEHYNQYKTKSVALISFVGTDFIVKRKIPWAMLFNKIMDKKTIIQYNLDLNRYILGIYELTNDKVTITSTNLYGQIKLTNFLAKIYTEYLSINRFIIKNSLQYKSLIIKPSTLEEQNQLDNLVKLGYLNDENGKYYPNNLTGFILPSCLSQAGLKDLDISLYKKINDIINHFQTIEQITDKLNQYLKQYIEPNDELVIEYFLKLISENEKNNFKMLDNITQYISYLKEDYDKIYRLEEPKIKKKSLNN